MSCVRSTLHRWLLSAALGLLTAASASAAPLGGAADDAVRLLNYYPSRNGWSYMWDRWDPQTMDRDFARIADLRFNTVRVILQVSSFTLPTPSEEALQKLERVIDMAEAHGLRVQLTLFDWFSAWGDLDGSRQWVDAVVGPYRNDPRIAFIDVCNEVDTTVTAQVNWAQTMVPYVRSVAGSTPVTISVTAKSGRSELQHLQTLVAADIALDLASVHFYGNSAAAYTRLSAVKQFIAPVPVIVGETGYSSYTGYSPGNTGPALFGVPPQRANTEAMQVHHMSALNQAANALQLSGVAPWAYADFTKNAIPPSNTGSNPVEYHFGMLRTDYSEKPVAGFLRNLNRGGPIVQDINGGFEQASDKGTPLLWRQWARPCTDFPPPACGYSAEFHVDTQVSHRGKASGRIGHAISSSYGRPAFFLSPTLPTLPGHFYRASAYARGKDISGTTRITVSWYTQTGCYIGGQSSASLPAGTSGWTPLSVSFTFPATTDSKVCSGMPASYVELRLESGAASPDGGGTAWFDDVRFEAF